MQEHTFAGRVEHGRFPIDVRSGIARALQSLEGKIARVTIEEERDTRSAAQLRWLFGTAYKMFVEHYGYDLDERREAKVQLHYALLKRCFGSRWDDKIGAEVPNVPASRNLNTKQCGEYMEWLVRYAAREGFIIELPDEFKGAA